MVMQFLETPRFPENISYGSSGGPQFKTTIFEGHSGVEQAGIEWSRARGRWNVAHGIRDKDDMDAIRAFFYNVKGRAVGFRFKDWSDFSVTDEQIGVGDGVTAVFKLTKTYTVGALSYVRRIFKPVSPIVVEVNNVVIPQGAGATQVQVDYTTGILTFGATVVAGMSGQAVTWTGEFDCAVRFDTDQLSASHDGFQVESWSNIPIVERLLDDA